MRGEGGMRGGKGWGREGGGAMKGEEVGNAQVTWVYC
jgi:hypothetical protein